MSVGNLPKINFQRTYINITHTIIQISNKNGNGWAEGNFSFFAENSMPL